MIPIEEIRAAALRIAGKVHRTPLLSAAQLGERAGVRLLLKCESFQKTGSFKPRGALNKVLSLSEAEKARGLVTVSAGNHAQAVAWAARSAGAACTVVMPSSAPRSKIDAVRGYGAEVILHGDRATLFDKLNEVREVLVLTFLHPVAHAGVLAGGGTTASSKGCTKVKPRASRTSFNLSKSVARSPCRITSAPYPRTASILERGALEGMTTVHAAPALRAAHATACAWLPADTVTRPRAFSTSESDRTLFKAPRGLKEPVF